MGTRRLDPEREHLRRILREMRLERGLHQADLAESIGQPQSFVSKYESGERRLEFVMVTTILTTMGVDFADFIQRWHREVFMRQNNPVDLDEED